MKARKRAPLTPHEARCCCVCSHWHRQDSINGECRHPERRWCVDYKDPETGTERHVEWWTTGCYATCDKWEGTQG